MSRRRVLFAMIYSLGWWLAANMMNAVAVATGSSWAILSSLEISAISSVALVGAYYSYNPEEGDLPQGGTRE